MKSEASALVVQALESHRRTVRKTWNEILLQVVDGDSPEIPPLTGGDQLIVLERLNSLFALLKGEAHMNLRWLMFAAGLDHTVVDLLLHRKPEHQMLAAEAAGRMRLKAALEQLNALVEDERSDVSLAAAHALVRIDPLDGMRTVMTELRRRSDWNSERVAEILSEARVHVRGHLAATLRKASGETRVRVIDIITALGDEAGLHEIRELLHHNVAGSHIPAAVAALRAAGDPRDEALIERFA